MDAQEPLIDRARTWLWAIGGIGIGLAAIFLPGPIHPFAPAVGFVASIVGLVTSLAMRQPVMFVLAGLGAAINVVAAVLLIAGAFG